MVVISSIVGREEEQVNAKKNIENNQQFKEVLWVESSTEEVPNLEDSIHCGESFETGLPVAELAE